MKGRTENGSATHFVLCVDLPGLRCRGRASPHMGPGTRFDKLSSSAALHRARGLGRPGCVRAAPLGSAFLLLLPDIAKPYHVRDTIETHTGRSG